MCGWETVLWTRAECGKATTQEKQMQKKSVSRKHIHNSWHRQKKLRSRRYHYRCFSKYNENSGATPGCGWGWMQKGLGGLLGSTTASSPTASSPSAPDTEHFWMLGEIQRVWWNKFSLIFLHIHCYVIDCKALPPLWRKYWTEGWAVQYFFPEENLTTPWTNCCSDLKQR